MERYQIYYTTEQGKIEKVYLLDVLTGQSIVTRDLSVIPDQQKQQAYQQAFSEFKEQCRELNQIEQLTTP